MQRLRDRLREATATAILEATEHVLSEEGLHAARIETIAQRAGIAVGTVYNYYADRDALLKALIQIRRAELIVAADRGLELGQGKPFAKQLNCFLNELLGHFDAHRAYFAVLLQGELFTSGIRTPAKDTIHELFARIEKLLKRGLRDKVLRAQDADIYPALLFGMIRGALVSRLVRGDTSPMVDIVEPVVRVFMQGAQERSR